MLKVTSHPLAHFDARPAGTTIDTFIVHAMHARGSSDEMSAENCIVLLDQNKVAAHYLITRRGRLYRLVEENARAWHAGVSKLPFSSDARENVNHFSIGVELIGYEDKPFASSQYRTLAALIRDVASRHPLRYILGHSQIAPARKSDPGPAFSWSTLQKQLPAKLAKLIRPS